MDDKRGRATPLERLPSLKPNRDLTLGGVCKRKFAPTIPPPKVKKERLDIPAHPEKSDPGRSSRGRGTPDRGGRGGHRGRGRGNFHNQNVVQMKSIFEDAPTERIKPRENRSFSGGGGGGGGGGYSRRSFANSEDIKMTKEEMKYESETTDVLKSLLNDNFIDVDYLSTTEPGMFPVLLQSNKKSVKRDLNDVCKPETRLPPPLQVKVKEEVKDDVPITEGEVVEDFKQKMSIPWDAIASEQNDAVSLSHLSNSCDNKRLYLIQLPDTLPGIPCSSSVAPKTTGGPSSAKENFAAAAVAAEEERNSLKDFTEGFLGKMKVRRSGKVEMILGNVVLDGSELPSLILQEAVVCEIDKKNPQWGDMTVIGHVTHRARFEPKIDTALASITS